MTKTKIAITLPEEQVAAARRAVEEGRARSVGLHRTASLARRDADEELSETLILEDLMHCSAADTHQRKFRNSYRQLNQPRQPFST